MHLLFGEVEALVREQHLIEEHRFSAFRARLKNLQRLGFPDGINTGKGRAARYLPDHVVLIALAMELAEFGLPPERSVRLLQSYRWTIANWARVAIDEASPPLVLLFDPALLSDEPADLDPHPLDIATSTFACVRADQVQEQFEIFYRAAGIRRLVLLNLSTILEGLLSSVRERSGQAAAEEFAKALATWGGEATDAG